MVIVVEDHPQKQSQDRQSYGAFGAPPIPDPTILTTAALEREILHLRELLEASISQVSAHLDIADEQQSKRFTLQIQDLSGQIRETDKRYQDRYEAQMEALDAARESAEKAVQAALASSNQALAKVEGAAEKRFDTVSQRIDDVKAITTQQISSIQTQIAAMAGRSTGGAAVWGFLIGGIGVTVAVITLILSLR